MQTHPLVFNIGNMPTRCGEIQKKIKIAVTGPGDIPIVCYCKAQKAGVAGQKAIDLPEA